MGNYLVVANQTLLSPDLTDGILETLKQDPAARFTLVVPATPVEDLLSPEGGQASQIAARRAGQALVLLTDLGVPVTGAHVGASSVVMAVDEAIGARQGYTGIILSTFPAGLSRWLESDLVHGLERAFRLPVTHIVAHVAHH